MPHQSRKWIFIRGLGRHSVHWNPFLEVFKKNFPKDEVELLDLRGNGSLSHSPSCLSITENVRDLRSRSKFIHQGEEVHLMTISLGSMIGAEWAHRYPDEVSGIVMINTSDRGTSSAFERMRPAHFLKMLSYLQKKKNRIELEKEILRESGLAISEIDKWAEIFARTPATKSINLARQLLAAGTFELPDHKPRTEVLLLCSEGDRMVHPQCTKRIAEKWVLKAQVHPTAGHDLPTHDPTWVCSQIKNWFQTIPGNS